MDNGKKFSLQVKEFYQKTKESLKLRPVLKRIGFSREITKISSQKVLANVPIWGIKKIQDYKRFSSKEKKEFLMKQFTSEIACVILTDGLSFLPEMEAEARKNSLSLFISGLSKKIFGEEIKKLDWLLSPCQAIISGGLLQIFDLGVLIIGDSGIGKSESALELISRGCRFVADDMTHFERTTTTRLIGKAPSFSRHFMEIRGLGIINIKEIFGDKSICRRTDIDLVIRLKKWEQEKDYDRIGLKFPDDYEILGVKIPQINIPVAPGRNIATLIEVACKVFMLKEKGYHAPKELIKRLDRALSLQGSGEER